jgi:hypothetical protein
MMDSEQAIVDHISSVIRHVWSREELGQLSMMQKADLRNSIAQRDKQDGPDSVTVEWMQQLKDQLEEEWSGALDGLLSISLGTCWR